MGYTNESGTVFEKRFIKTGLSDGINIQVKEGLTKDSKIKGEEKKEDKKAEKKNG